MEGLTPVTVEVREVFSQGRNIGAGDAESEFDRWFAPYADGAAAIQRVRELHEPFEMIVNFDLHATLFCAVCVDEDGEEARYPCPTIEAMDGSHE